MAFFLDHCLSLNIALLYFTVINQIMSYHSQGYLPPERHCLQPALSPNTNALMVGLQAAHETRCYFKKQEKKKKNPKRLIIMTFTRSNFFLNLTLLKDNMNQKSRDRHTFFFFFGKGQIVNAAFASCMGSVAPSQLCNHSTKTTIDNM